MRNLSFEFLTVAPPSGRKKTQWDTDEWAHTHCTDFHQDCVIFLQAQTYATRIM